MREVSCREKVTYLNERKYRIHPCVGRIHVPDAPQKITLALSFSSAIKTNEISTPCARCPQLLTPISGKNVRLVHGWIRYVSDEKGVDLCGSRPEPRTYLPRSNFCEDSQRHNRA